MIAKIVNACAGTAFMYSKGDVISSDSTPIERIKDLIRGGHAVEVDASGNAVRNTARKPEVEKR